MLTLRLLPAWHPRPKLLTLLQHHHSVLYNNNQRRITCCRCQSLAVAARHVFRQQLPQRCCADFCVCGAEGKLLTDLARQVVCCVDIGVKHKVNGPHHRVVVGAIVVRAVVDLL